MESRDHGLANYNDDRHAPLSVHHKKYRFVYGINCHNENNNYNRGFRKNLQKKQHKGHTGLI